MFSSVYLSKFGRMVLKSRDGESLSEAYFEGREVSESGKQGVLAEAEKWLDNYFMGKKVSPLDLPLDLSAGGSFSQWVWKRLCLIPYGKTATYGELAKEIAGERGLAKMSAQAIGGAVRRNPIAIIVPCHRVIGAKGNLTGYAGGLDLKKKLLQLEGSYRPEFFLPGAKKRR